MLHYDLYNCRIGHSISISQMLYRRCVATGMRVFTSRWNLYKPILWYCKIFPTICGWWFTDFFFFCVAKPSAVMILTMYKMSLFAFVVTECMHKQVNILVIKWIYALLSKQSCTQNVNLIRKKTCPLQLPIWMNAQLRQFWTWIYPKNEQHNRTW